MSHRPDSSEYSMVSAPTKVPGVFADSEKSERRDDRGGLCVSIGRRASECSVQGNER